MVCRMKCLFPMVGDICLVQKRFRLHYLAFYCFWFLNLSRGTTYVGVIPTNGGSANFS